VLGANDDVIEAGIIARTAASNFTRLGDPARIREFSTCKAVTKKAQAVTRQELHVADIGRIRACRACGGNNKSKLCKPHSASTTERTEAQTELARLKAASF
jgi:hypothetical protein